MPTDYRPVDPAKLIKALRGKDGNQIRRKLQARMERVTESKRLVDDEGLSLRQAGKVLGVSHEQVRKDLSTESVSTKKVDTHRQRLRVQINSGTKPEAAAEKINSTFGPDFAQALKAQSARVERCHSSRNIAGSMPRRSRISRAFFRALTSICRTRSRVKPS